MNTDIVRIKKIRSKIIVESYLITFEYETKKGYRREQQRIINITDKQDVKEEFNNWNKTVRTIFNAKILSIVKLIEKTKVIEI